MESAFEEDIDVRHSESYFEEEDPQDNEGDYKHPLEEEDIRLIDETAAWL